MKRRLFFSIALIAMTALSFAHAADVREGTPQLKSAGPLAFGPEGVLFMADPKAAAIIAVETQDTSGKTQPINVENIGQKVADMLGVSQEEARIIDMAVNPASGTVYLSVARGRGPQATPVLMKVQPNGKLEEFSIKNVKYDRVEFDNAPSADAVDRRDRSLRQESITDMAFVDGQLLVAGLSNEEFASKLRSIPYPFSKSSQGASVEIFHGAHGRFETRSPVRTLAMYGIGGEQHVLAAYTCTPLVKFPLSSLEPGAKVKGVTVAELGNRNRPLDMFVYNKGGKDYVLMANSARGVMKISTDEVSKIEGITEKIQGTAGLKYDTIEKWQGVEQLDRIGENHAIMLVKSDSGQLDLKTEMLP